MFRKLLFSVTKKDFVETHIRGSGPGGQHRNKTSTGVRFEHPPSGAVGQATDNKSQKVNKKNAFLRLVETEEFKNWLRLQVAKTSHEKETTVRNNERIRTYRFGRYIVTDHRTKKDYPLKGILKGKELDKLISDLLCKGAMDAEKNNS